MPTTVAKDIEKVMRDFRWNGGNDEKYDHLVAWEDVCQPKAKGGLGIRNLALQNKALSFKRLWRFPQEKNSLWYKVIKSKYGLQQNNWDSKMAHRTTHRSPWKFISSQYNVIP
ncbi:hypothetical protein PanWU01x14_287660 [Parasponia andersonii]|uniref:Uncharacterized protein n=1 Tax=Parasponia andersonii TaxID=3476 RepID=A0A2P5AYS9_PARAD|nr:hypothetical protein PanWU01x14_287660 [Parasponia andersonii]